MERGVSWQGRGRRRPCRSSCHATIAAWRSRSRIHPSGCGPPPATRRVRRTSPFANFFFGGFGNNYVDYQRREAVPGVLQLSRRRAERDRRAATSAKGTVEWNLPPWRFSHAGTPGFYATWLRPAVFVSGLATDIGRAVDRGARQRAPVASSTCGSRCSPPSTSPCRSAAAVVVEPGPAPLARGHDFAQESCAESRC